MNESERKAAVRTAMRNPQPAVRNTISPAGKAQVIPPKTTASIFEGLNDKDKTVRVFVTRTGVYYPGRMQQSTEWRHLRIESEGEVIECWHGSSWGYDGDWTVLDFACRNLEKVEEWDEEIEEHPPEFLTGESYTRFFRHIADIIVELKREGSVNI